MTLPGTVVITAPLLAWPYALIFARWRRGLYWLVAYMPFAGMVTIALNLWPPSLLFKDVFFVIPLYIAFFASLALHRESIAGFPKPAAFLMLSLAALTILQAANPGVANTMMALIGLKVWLFYLPLCLAAYVFADSADTVLGLFRLLVGLSFVPAAVALAELGLTHHFGFRAAMQMVYGAAAEPATQRFASFEVGGGSFGRLPSTFTFATQFFGYSLAMLAPAYVVSRVDGSAGWRRAGRLALVTAVLATFISGERAAFVFTPLTLGLAFFLDRGLRGLAAGLTQAAVIAWVAVVAGLGIALSQMYWLVAGLFVTYGREAAYGGLLQAITSAPLGMGTGTNTGPARYALHAPDSFRGIENYYAKAAYELGIPGLLTVVVLFLAIIVIGFRARRGMTHPALRCCANAILAFLAAMFLNSFKGWQIDVDPINAYYWIFAGILFKLPVLDEYMLAHRTSFAEAPRPRVPRPVGEPAYGALPR